MTYICALLLGAMGDTVYALLVAVHLFFVPAYM